MNRPTIYLLSLLPTLALASCSSSSDEQAGDEAVTPAESIATPIEDTAPPEASLSVDSMGNETMGNSFPVSELIALGDIAFNTTPGFCAKCHNAGGVGGEKAPDLTDEEWVQCDGTVEGIRTVIISGVPKDKHSKPGYKFGMNSATKMNLDDTTIDALAAYIHSLSQ